MMRSMLGEHDHSWGEARERARLKYRYRAGTAIVALSVVVALVLPPLAEKVATGVGASQAAAWASAAMAASLLVLATVAVTIGWRQSDEVQRRQGVNAWAAGGIAAWLLNPIAGMLAPLAGWHDTSRGVWIATLIIVAATMFWQRWRA